MNSQPVGPYDNVSQGVRRPLGARGVPDDAGRPRRKGSAVLTTMDGSVEWETICSPGGSRGTIGGRTLWL